jgi:hypothetical protein
VVICFFVSDDLFFIVAGALGTGIKTTVDITPLVMGNGNDNLALTATSGTAFSLASRESGTKASCLSLKRRLKNSSTRRLCLQKKIYMLLERMEKRMCFTNRIFHRIGKFLIGRM